MSLLHNLSLALLLGTQAVTPTKPPDCAAQQQQIRELSTEVVRLRIALKTQSAAAHDLAEQMVRAEIAQQQQQDAAAAKAAQTPAPKPSTEPKP